MIRNANGEKVSAKVFVQNRLANAVGVATTEVLDEVNRDEEYTPRERGLIEAQFGKILKRLNKVLGAKNPSAASDDSVLPDASPDASEAQ